MPKVKRGIAKKALAGARKLEKIPFPSISELKKEHSKDLVEVKNLQKLLKPEWFVKDTDKPKAGRRKK
jgi:hypothetical protein